MHLHFVQSLEPLQGAGLGQAALSLHLAMRRESVQCSVSGFQPDKPQAPRVSPHAPSPEPHASTLLATRAADFDRAWPGVIQGVRKGPAKAFYAPELKHLAAEALASAEWFHGHGFYVWTNWWLGSEARRRGKPMVYHPHGFFDPWILSRSRAKKRLAGWLFEDANTRHVRWWRALSSKEADQIRAAVGAQAVVHVIPNGIDIHEVDSAQCSVGSGQRGEATPAKQSGVGPGVPDAPGTSIRDRNTAGPEVQPYQETRHDAWTRRRRPKRLLFLSRIHPKKGLDLLVPAWGRLTTEFPDWELLIVGPDEGGYQALVERMISDAGCADTCRIHPAVSGAEKHAVLRTADLFVLPSYSEGFPMAVLEAAAHRIPVVQTTECNFPELAAAGGAWECAPQAGELEKALRAALAAEDAERMERGARGRALVEQNYAWGQIAKDVMSACS